VGKERRGGEKKLGNKMISSGRRRRRGAER